MPDRDYYLRDDKALAATRTAYKKYLGTMLGLAGLPDADNRADAVFALEKKIAKAQWSRADRRDRDKTYNPMPYPAAKEAGAEVSLGRLFQGKRYSTRRAERQAADRHRRREIGLSEARQHFRRDAGFRLARLSDRPLSAQLRGLPAEALRRGKFRLLRQGAGRRAATARPSDARRASARRHDRRGARQALCRALFPARSQGQGEHAGRQSAQGL